MTTPFYVSPEQMMKDRADFARKGIARGRSVVVVQYRDGLLFVAENQSRALHKISELYDRLAFAAVGRYNEFENLRIAGVRLADMRGYSYDRRDVTGRGLANAYAQTLGTIFSSGGEKPYEVEIFVAEVGDVAPDDQIYRLTYDGSVADEHGFAVMGGSAEQVSEHLRSHYEYGLELEVALELAVAALGHDSEQVRTVTADKLEVAVLDRSRTLPRKFRRLTEARLEEIFGPPPADSLTQPSQSEPEGSGDDEIGDSSGVRHSPLAPSGNLPEPSEGEDGPSAEPAPPDDSASPEPADG